MPTQTNLNVDPFFDDFDETKRFHRVLFRPAKAVQTRELNQVQSILQNQIERFGNHIFKNGAIVDGCSIADMNPLPYVRLADKVANGTFINVALLANTMAVSNTSGLKAKVVAYNAGAASQYPNTNIVYLSYLNTGNTGGQFFANNETLTFYNLPLTGNNTIDIALVVNTFTSNSTTITTGNAHAMSVTDGIVYQNGFFIKVDSQIGIVKPYDTDAGNNVVGFHTTETIITPDTDTSLVDNALGYPNKNAPGAYRLKLTANLITLDANTAANTIGFNPVAIYNFGTLVQNQETPYSALETELAQRTYEEAGNYVISPFKVDTISGTANSSFMQARVSPGSGYTNGFRVELLKSALVNVRRGTDIATVNQQQITTVYGNFLTLKEVSGNFDFDSFQTVTLYDTAQKAVTNHLWASTTPNGNAIGTAQLREFEYGSGQPGSNTATFNAYLFNVQLNAGKSLSSVASIYYNNAGLKGFADVSVAQGGLTGSGANRLFWGFGKSALVRLRDQSNNNNSEYVYRNKKTTTLNADGTIAVTLTGSSPGGVDIMPYGVATLPDAVVPEFVIIASANGQTASLTGTVAISTSSNTVTGTSTTFTSNFSTGEVIKVGTDIRIVTAVANATSLTVDAPFSSTVSGQTYVKYFPAGYIFPMASSLAGTRYINVTNSTSATIQVGSALSTSMTVTVYHNVLRTNVVPAKKVINKHRYVKIDTTTNPNGPWCLGFSDVHKLRNVWANTANTYAANGISMTGSFLFDPGQKDDKYGLAYLYPDSGVSVTSTPYLTVELDYFSANTTAGVGFYTVESYPIDDANTANVNAITTVDLPLYVSASGDKIPLRDVVDFRPVATPTATDTGTLTDPANNAQIATALVSASYNPSNTVTLSIPTGSHVPNPYKNFQSDVQYYLPRKDLFFISSSGALKVKEGAPADNPLTPLYPDNGMTVAVLAIPPYPSLTTDQVDYILGVNLTSFSPIRDSGNQTGVNIVTNRRYTMKDIGVLDQRITNLEYYVSLSLLEKQAADLTITDSTGLNRFKNGIFVDPFNDHSLGDVSNLEYRIAVDEDAGVARPYIRRERIPTLFNSGTSTNVQKTGRLVTLPYTSVPILSQVFATKYRGSAPVAFRWNGTMKLYPTYSNDKDIINTGSINVQIDNGTQAWQEFAASPYGTIYGDWRTTTSSTSNTVSSGTPTTVVQNVYVPGTTTTIALPSFNDQNSPQIGVDEASWEFNYHLSTIEQNYGISGDTLVTYTPTTTNVGSW